MPVAAKQEFFELHDFRFSLSYDCLDLKGMIDHLFPSLRSTPANTTVDFNLQRIVYKGNSTQEAVYERNNKTLYQVRKDGAILFEKENIEDLFNALEWSMTMTMLEHLKHLIQVHASGIVSGGRAILFAGASGAGKSSLALSFLMRGWKCLSDEVVFIEPSTLRLLSFPRPFQVDRKTTGLFPALNKPGVVMPFGDTSGKVRIDPAVVRPDWWSFSAMPWCLVFPDHSPGHATEMVPIGETPALSLLTAFSINLADLGAEGLDNLSLLVRQYPAYMLKSHDLIAATDIVGQFAETAGGSLSV